ncbi:ShlB/FhaC/HecB family hemolysin secretion/activation protein [Spirulina sp. CS-785/01]|uniref:ShlB/FhaC/HecB family hemolysin secretion/activation protein n=1 Tax=Spirulina sp. CS-785/01 TaxID=3021716 RepID=UPI00232DCF2A|nr:ShlB/FhaC/HecB family hemolysin secretion/activation protein [Spirulina sp. CS-785/01]
MRSLLNPVEVTKSSRYSLNLLPVFALVSILWGLTGITAQSQATSLQLAQGGNPNQDRFLQPNRPDSEGTPEDPQDSEEDPQDSEESPQEQPPTATPQNLPQPSPGNIQVNTLTITGSSLFSQEDFNRLIEPYLGQQVSQESLQRLVDRITEQYLEQGYITSRAVLKEDSLPTGEIQIEILEGGIEAIEIEGTDRLNPDYIRDRIALGTDTPLNTGTLENQLRLLRTNSLIDNIEASLRSGNNANQSILVVRVTEARAFRASFSADNYSPPSVGSERLNFTVGHLNTTGMGDSFFASYRRTAQGGSDTYDLSYSRPLNPMDGTLQLRTSFNRNNVVTEDFSFFDIRGDSSLYEVSFRQPFIKTPREEFALSLGFTYQTGQTRTFQGPTPFGEGPEEDGTTTTSTLKFGQEYIRRDARGAWALRSQFSIGLGIFDATLNPDLTPDSRFVSWLGQIQRVQILNENNFLILSADLQLAADPLLPSQQFVIGGGQSVRGYRQNARFGDNGLRFSAEDRITLIRNEAGTPQLILAPFLDLGWVWNNDNPNTLADQTFLAGIGLGAIWEVMPGFTVRLDYGYPFVDLEDRTQNLQDDGVYFSATWNF